MITKLKDDRFMRKGMPLNLDDKNKLKLYEYLDSRNINGNGIHVIKGDLHTENINSCLKLEKIIKKKSIVIFGEFQGQSIEDRRLLRESCRYFVNSQHCETG